MIKGIDHVAIAVHSLEEALPLYRDLLGFDLEGIEVVKDQEVKVAILVKGPHRVELLEPVSDTSPITSFLAKRGPGMHHLCLEVEGLSGLLESLSASGVRLIDSKPRPGAAGRHIAFVHPKGTGGVLVELSERAP